MDLENKEKIRIYLQYPWKFPDSPYYKSLVENAPENIEYLNAKKQKGVITNKRFFWLSNFLKKTIRKSLKRFNLSLLNIHVTKSDKNFDLIHCAHCLSGNDFPWVADFESLWQMRIGKKTDRSKQKIAKVFRNKNCKKIISWTNQTKKEILKEFPEIGNKIEVVYPAIPFPKKGRRKHKEINLLFTARYFYPKGGLHALESMDSLTKKYDNVRGIIVSDVPLDIKKKYSPNKKIIFYDLMSQKRLFEEIYPNSDIFIYPGYSDSFGFSILESMSFGIPVITVDGFARKEILEDGKTGFIIKNYGLKWNKTTPILNKEDLVLREIVEKTENLIKNSSLRKKMKNNCINVIKRGKFSIKERNDKLKKIYESAIK